MSRCKACNKALAESFCAVRRIKLETGEVIQVEEELCSTCRSKVYEPYDNGEVAIFDNDFSDAVPAISEWRNYGGRYEDS